MFSIDWLGPVDLRRAGQPLPLAIRKSQALLVLLAREGAMPRERVVALLWPALDESTARRNLRRELARLRDAGAGEVIQADGDRLALAAGADVTARRFEAAVAEQRPEEALALWRGPPADGLHLDDAAPWEEWMSHERRRLDGLRVQALSMSAAQHEAAGELALALDRVHILLAADPLQEGHHLAAMRLLERQGQRAAALAQYDSCARLLADELGLEPMHATRALAAALRGPGPAPATAPPSPAVAAPAGPADLLPACLPFVGRQHEVAWLERAWRSGRPLLIEGEGGVGKTRLVSDFAAAHGPYAIVSCRASDAELPLSSFTRSLRALAGPKPAVHDLPGWVQDDIARLMPELGRSPRPMRSQEEHTRFGQAVGIAWQHWMAGNFDAMVIDDWHLADERSQALWMQMHAGGDGPLRLILVYRPSLTPAAAERLVRERQGGAEHLRLDPLPPEAVFELMQRLSRRPEPRRFAAMLSRATDGNPFYVAETLRHLIERGLLTAGDDGSWRTPFDDRTEGYDELPLPDSVRSAVLARVARLPERSRRVLQAAALADEPIDAGLLAPACALSEVEATLALEDALQARLLREPEGGGLTFVHHLVQQALDSTLDAARRRSVHRRLALGAAAAGAPAARIAAHHEAGGEPQRAVPWRRRAGDEALRLHALDEAVAHWRQALVDGAPAGEAMAIRQQLMRTLGTDDRRDEAMVEADAVLRLAGQGAGDTRSCIEARIAVAALYARRDAAAQALALLDDLPALTDRRLCALALSARSDALRDLGRLDEARELAEQALGLGGLNDDDRGELLDSLTITHFYGGRMQQALERTDEWLALARARGDDVVVARALGRRASIVGHSGDLAAAEPALHEAVAMCDRLGLRAYQRYLLYNLCVLYSSQSRPQAVLQAARSCWALQPPLAQETMRTMVQLAFVEAHGALGDLGAAHPWALGAIDDAVAVGQLHAAASVVSTGAELLHVLGEGQRLAPLLAMMAGPEAQQGITGLTEPFLVLAECELLAGQAEAARGLRQRAAPGEPQETERVRLRATIVDAALLLLDGQALLALQRLPADDAPGLNDELRWRALAVRLRAEAASAGCARATLDAAEAALARDGVHALAALQLHHTLLQVAETPARRRAWQRRVAALSATLHPVPPLRTGFDQRWLGRP